MNVLQNLSIKTRLGIGYVVLTCALILVAVMGIRGMSMTQERLDNQVNRLNVIKSLGNRVLDTANARAVSARNLVIAGSKEDAEAETRRIGVAHEAMGKALQGVEKALKTAPQKPPRSTRCWPRSRKPRRPMAPWRWRSPGWGAWEKKMRPSRKSTKNAGPC
jgi:hypothetical protein